MNKFKLKATLSKIKSYYDDNYVEGEVYKEQKDFYNFITYEFTCGKCDKTMSSTKALFHWHFK